MSVKNLLAELDTMDQKLKGTLKNSEKKFPKARIVCACSGCMGTQMCSKIPVDLEN